MNPTYKTLNAAPEVGETDPAKMTRLLDEKFSFFNLYGSYLFVANKN